MSKVKSLGVHRIGIGSGLDCCKQNCGLLIHLHVVSALDHIFHNNNYISIRHARSTAYGIGQVGRAQDVLHPLTTSLTGGTYVPEWSTRSTGLNTAERR